MLVHEGQHLADDGARQSEVNIVQTPETFVYRRGSVATQWMTTAK